jgi:gluconolactonase
VETYVAKFPALYWESKTIWIARHEPDRLDPMDRGVLLILFAEHLEHLLDSDILYYNERAGRFFVEHGKMAAEIAQALGVPRLAAELRAAIIETESNRTLAWPAEHRFRDDSFVVVPRSCRRRFTAMLRGRAYWCRRKFLLLGRQTSQSIKRGRRWLVGHRSPAAGLVAKSPMFFDLFPKDAIPERIATGFRFTEGPVWIHEKERLLFSDIPANCIYELAADGCITKFRELSGNSNGLTIDRQGRLIACEHGNRRVTRTEADGSVTVLAESFRGKKLNSPNDVVVKSDGAIYFTDPAYGIRADEQEQQIEGVYRLSPDGRALSLVADDFARPNGLAFSPDEKHLYIDDSRRRQIRVFKVEADGSLSGGSVFHDMNIAIPGSPDGMKVDAEGRVYCTGAGGIWVFDKDGNHLGTIVTPEKPSNCAWGGADWRTLYITACTSVYAARLRAPGAKLLRTRL